MTTVRDIEKIEANDDRFLLDEPSTSGPGPGAPFT